MALQKKSSASVRPWEWESSAVLHFFHTRATGLTEHEASLRLKANGYNELEIERNSGFDILMRQLKSPLLFILVVATGLSFYLGEHESAITILGMIILSIVLGFINEYRSEKIVSLLNKHIEATTTVMRQGSLLQIPTRNVTVGDVIPLSPGMIVPADMRLIESDSLEVDESPLTGESVAVEKTIAATPNMSRNPVHLKNCAFFGTYVAAGHGLGVVYAVGQKTAYGAITKTVTHIRPATEFQHGLTSFSYLLVRVISTMSILIFLVNMLLHHTVINSLLFALSIAIGLTPELLPAIVSVSLAQGAHRLAKRKMIVKQLVAIEGLGNLDVICTDKTGTLTEGKLHVSGYYNPYRESDSGVLALARWSCERSRVHHILKSPFDQAIMEHTRINPTVLHSHPLKNIKHLYSLPFDFNRRRTSVVVAAGRDHLLITKGAVETMLDVCKHARKGDKLVPIAEVAAEIKKSFFAQSDNGYRVLAVASKVLTSKTKPTLDDESGMILEGFIDFVDPLKKSAIPAIQELRSLDVRLCLISGDHELVCKRVCTELGMEIKDIINGDELEKMSDIELQHALKTTDIFARVSPEQKLRIIRGFKGIGLTVGFIGDGINDAPSLKNADVGISVVTGVDVAKEAASAVLLRSDLEVISAGIIEGRHIFTNTIKYILMGTSSNFGNMISAGIGSFVLPFLPMLPTQILLTNVLYDVSQLTIPSDNVDAENLRKPRHWNISFIQKYMIYFGIISSLYDFITFALMFYLFHFAQARFETGWFIESLITQTAVVYVIRTRRYPFFLSAPSVALLISGIIIIAVGLSIPKTILGTYFSFANLPISYYAYLSAIALGYLILVDALKVVFYKTIGKRY